MSKPGPFSAAYSNPAATMRATAKPLSENGYHPSPRQADAPPQSNHGAQVTNLSARWSPHSSARQHHDVAHFQDSKVQKEPSARPAPPPSQKPHQHQIQQQHHHQHRDSPHPHQHQQRPKPQLHITTHAHPVAPTQHNQVVAVSAANGMAATPSPAQHQVFHPDVMRASAAALLPAQSLFENAWQVTVHRVQTEFSRTHASLTNKIDAEKAAHARALDTCTHLRSELEDARYERGLVNSERERLSVELVKVANENLSLRTNVTSAMSQLKEAKERCRRLQVENEIWKESWGVAKSVKAKIEDRLEGKVMDSSTHVNDRDETTLYPPGLMDRIQKQIDIELEARVGKLLAEAREERVDRSQEEKNLDIQSSQLRTTLKTPSPTDSHTSSPSNDRQSDHSSHSESSTAVGTPPSGSPTLKLETHRSTSPQEPIMKVSASSRPSPSPCSFVVSPGLQNMMGVLELERRRPSKLADDACESGDKGGLRPFKRRRTECGQEEGEHDEQSENASCRRELNESGDSELSENEHHVKNARSEAGESTDDMQLESDSEVVVDEPKVITLSAPQVRKKKIGIKHIDLLYETQRQRMVCRMCLTRKSAGVTAPATSFPLDASWAALIGHCEDEHPAAREVLERMSAVQVIELRQRLL